MGLGLHHSPNHSFITPAHIPQALVGARSDPAQALGTGGQCKNEEDRWLAVRRLVSSPGSCQSPRHTLVLLWLQCSTLETSSFLTPNSPPLCPLSFVFWYDFFFKVYIWTNIRLCQDYVYKEHLQINNKKDKQPNRNMGKCIKRRVSYKEKENIWPIHMWGTLNLISDQQN